MGNSLTRLGLVAVAALATGAALVSGASDAHADAFHPTLGGTCDHAHFDATATGPGGQRLRCESTATDAGYIWVRDTGQQPAVLGQGCPRPGQHLAGMTCRQVPGTNGMIWGR